MRYTQVLSMCHAFSISRAADRMPFSPCGRRCRRRMRGDITHRAAITSMYVERSRVYTGWRDIILAALCCFFSISVQADNNAITQLQTTLDRYQQVTTQFNQSTYDTNGSVSLSASGSMALLRPGYFRWQTDKPNQQIIVVGHDRLTIYDVDLQQASVQPMDKSIGEAPAALLLNSAALLVKQYTIEPQPKRTPGLWFRLTPKGTDAPMAFVDLQINQQQLQSMQVMDNLGQLTVIRFTKQNFQPHLKESNFTLHLPKNVDVVNEGVTVH